MLAGLVAEQAAPAAAVPTEPALPSPDQKAPQATTDPEAKDRTKKKVKKAKKAKKEVKEQQQAAKSCASDHPESAVGADTPEDHDCW